MNSQKSYFAWPLARSCVLSLVVALFAVTLHAQTFSSPTNLAQNTSSRPSAAAIAVGGNGEINVAWAGTSGLIFSHSTDQGKTFSGLQTIAGGAAGSQQIAADSSGNVYIAWTDGSTVWLSRSSDDGAMFSTPTNVSQGVAATAPQMALDVNGGINIAWGRSDTYFSRSNNGGLSFPTPVRLSRVAQDAGTPSIAVGPTDVIYVVWTDELNHPQCHVYFSRSPAGGAGFSAPADIPNPGCAFNSQVATDPSGNVDVLWRNDSPNQDVFFTRSSDGGLHFSAALDLSSSAVFNPQMTVDASGNISVVWEAGMSGTSGAIAFRRSADGANFSAAKTVNVPGPVGTLSATTPQIAVDPNDNIDVAWQQGAPGSDDSRDTLFSLSTDAGAHFSPPAKVSDTAATLGGTERMAVDASGNVNIAWVDPPKTFFSRGNISQQSSGDFTIGISPASQSMLPGGSVAYFATLSAKGGFNQAVTLSCNGVPAGAACAFDKTSVTPSDSGSHVNFALTVPPTLAAGNYTFTVSAASGATKHTQEAQVTVGGLNGSITPTAATIAAGSSSDFGVTLNSTGGFAGQVNLACSGQPAGVTCSFNATPVTVAANGRVMSTLTVHVASKPTGSAVYDAPRDLAPLSQKLPLACWFAVFMAVAMLEVLRRRDAARPAWMRGLTASLLIIALGAGLVACSGSVKSTGTNGGSSGTGTTSGTGGGSSAVTFPMTVQAQSGTAHVDLATISITVP